MNIAQSEALLIKDGDKLFICVETNAEGIADFKESSKYDDLKVVLGTMIVEGKKVPAFKFEVTDSEWYKTYMREEWKNESAWRMGQRCIICGENGKSKRCPLRIKNPNYTGKEGETKTIAVDCTMCPYDRQFKPVRGTVFFSTLDLKDADGNVDVFEPESNGINTADTYFKLLHDFIAYIKEHYPRYAHYTELVELLGDEIEMKEAAAKMNRPDKTLYGWVKRLRPIFDEFMSNVDYL